MRAGEWRRPSWPTRFGWSVWLLRVVAWGRLARLGLAWGSAGLGTAWRGAFAPSCRPGGVSDPSRQPEGGCGPSGLPEASDVALREAEGPPRSRAAGWGEGDEAVVVPLAPVGLCPWPFPAGVPHWDRPHVTTDQNVCHSRTGGLRVRQTQTGPAPAPGRTRPSGTSGQPAHAHARPHPCRSGEQPPPHPGAPGSPPIGRLP